jgi:hypothetical protein
MRRSILVSLLASLAVSPSFAQTQRTSYLSSPPIEKMEGPRSDRVNEDSDSTLYLAHSLAEKTLALRDLRARSIGAARIADVLWPRDEAYARVLFDKALHSINSADDKAADPRLLLGLRRSVATIIARRDFDWGKLLIDSAAQTGDADCHEYQRCTELVGTRS